jgi:hypothetical protein
MKKILIINSWFHEKNKQGLIKILNFLHEQKEIEYKVGTVNDIPNYDIIYNPSQPIDASLYPSKKFIFGPHFSTFPHNNQLQSIKNTTHHNSIYIQPSEWAAQVWKNMGAEQYIPIKSFPFPVDTDKFKPIPNLTITEKQHEQAQEANVLVYYKHRIPYELNILKEFLANHNIHNYKVFDYKQHYNENDYLSCLQNCIYGIVLDAHESQGFAIEEALSCNVPLLVWNALTMNQELNSRCEPIPCTSIPYWDSRCGEYFHTKEELESTFQTFQTKLNANAYTPRQYILENLTTEKCAERFMELIT